MNIKVNNTKEITEPLKKEMVWREACKLQDTIAYLYRDSETRQFSDSKMEGLYYKINDICVELANDDDMAWQLEEDDA